MISRNGKRKKVVAAFGAYGSSGSGVCRYNYVHSAKIVMAGRDPIKLANQEDEYRDPVSVLSVLADANKPEDVKKVFQAAKEKFGRVDEVWITIGKDGAWEMDFSTDPEEKRKALWEKLYPSLLQPVEVITPIAEEFFRKQKFGLLVHLSSHVAFKGENVLPGNHTYRKLKVAAEEVVLKMRQNLKGTGASAVNLRPALIATKNNAKFLDTEKKRKEAVQPEDLAEWVDKWNGNPNIPESHYFAGGVTV